jgi:hypothetical protein
MIYILVFLIFISLVYAQNVYKWTDEKGVIRFSDDLDGVPPAYRDRVKVEKWEDKRKPEASSPAPSRTPLQNMEEGKTDIYGQDETYWRGRVRPWKERLEEANANYARVQSEYTEKSEEAVQRKYGSHTQYKSTSIELDRLREEMARYQAQMDEANKMVDKIAKEAEEAKADPEWIK